MKRIGQLSGVNSVWQTLTNGVPFNQPFKIKGDSGRQGGIVFYDVEVKATGPVSLQFNHSFPADWCTATPDDLPWLWNPPTGNSRMCIPVLMATVADVTTTPPTDIPALPTPDATVTCSIEQVGGASGLAQVKIHVSGMWIRLTEGVQTDAPWW